MDLIFFVGYTGIGVSVCIFAGILWYKMIRSNKTLEEMSDNVQNESEEDR